MVVVVAVVVAVLLCPMVVELAVEVVGSAGRMVELLGRGYVGDEFGGDPNALGPVQVAGTGQRGRLRASRR